MLSVYLFQTLNSSKVHQSLIQSFESERDKYLKDFGSKRFSFVRDIAERVVGQNPLFGSR
jgi:hypothetical protein